MCMRITHQIKKKKIHTRVFDNIIKKMSPSQIPDYAVVNNVNLDHNVLY